MDEWTVYRLTDTALQKPSTVTGPLHIRVWECGACGAVLDRDINAAVNVAKAAGLAVTACRAQVRPVFIPAQRGEAGTHRDGQPTVVGIPGL
jgi:putative transposase